MTGWIKGNKGEEGVKINTLFSCLSNYLRVVPSIVMWRLTSSRGRDKYSFEFHKFEAPVWENNTRLDQRYRFGSHQQIEGKIN